MIDRWVEAIARERAVDPFQRDEGFLAGLVPRMEWFGKYFATEVRGLENIPVDGPVLLVGNHSGGVLTPDTSAVFASWYRTFGLQRPLYGLALDAAFAIPGFNRLMRKIGQIPASPENAAAALSRRAGLLVYPGGDHEVFRPYRDRNKVDFGGRTGFIKLALKLGVPVVPVVSHGGHNTTMVLTRGEGLAKALQMARMRVNVYPVLLQFPWGISTAALVGLPMPAKITMEVLPPLRWSQIAPEEAEDPAILNQCYEEITGVMQATLDDLVREHPRPIISRLKRLFRRENRNDQTEQHIDLDADLPASGLAIVRSAEALALLAAQSRDARGHLGQKAAA
jgi:1-acyl-sn-glycerol-3-phosphate acyltransferase